MLRGQTGVGFGDGGNEALQRAIRVQGNNLEYVPIALVLILVLEIMGAWVVALSVLGAALTLARLAHGFSLGRSTGTSPGRFAGTLVTWIVILAGGVWTTLMGLGVL